LNRICIDTLLSFFPKRVIFNYTTNSSRPKSLGFPTQFFDEELAELCGRSKSTVAHCFSQGEHRREPSEADKRRLAEIHALWTQFENEPAHLRKIWARKRQRQRPD
jgi:hypothetical protein